MKKPSKKTENKSHVDALQTALSRFNDEIHGDLEKITDLLEKNELEGFLGDNGFPNLDKIDEDENITAQQVLLLGSYGAIKSGHDDFHNIISDELGDKHNKSVHSMNIDELPTEIKKALKEAVNEIEKIIKDGSK